MRRLRLVIQAADGLHVRLEVQRKAALDERIGAAAARAPYFGVVRSTLGIRKRDAHIVPSLGW